MGGTIKHHPSVRARDATRAPFGGGGGDGGGGGGGWGCWRGIACCRAGRVHDITLINVHAWNFVPARVDCDLTNTKLFSLILEGKLIFRL